MNVGGDRFGFVHAGLCGYVNSCETRGLNIVSLHKLEDCVRSQDRAVLVCVWKGHLGDSNAMKIF